jgi:UDP-N-acetylmuramate--alanine ligase
VDFANKVPFYGSVVACVDDPHVRDVCRSITRRVVTYGLDPSPAGAEPLAVSGRDVKLGSFGGQCAVFKRVGGEETALGLLELAVPGRHNLQNALAAVAVSIELGIDFARVAATLREFHGAERRFERVGEANGVLVVDDYGHHPTEIAAVLSAARVTLGRRLLVAFQPHRYTRTQHLMTEFGPAFADADEVVLTDIYAASEEPIAGVTVEALAESVARASGRPVRVVKRIDELAADLANTARPGDAVITLGAGSIAAVPKKLLAALRERETRA